MTSLIRLTPIAVLLALLLVGCSSVSSGTAKSQSNPESRNCHLIPDKVEIVATVGDLYPRVYVFYHKPTRRVFSVDAIDLPDCPDAQLTFDDARELNN